MVVDRDHLAVDAILERAGATARADVLADQRVLRIGRHVADVLRLGVPAHAQHQRVVGIQYRTVGRDLDHDALDLGELLERVHALQAEVIGLHVEYRADVDLRHAHAGADQPAARGLEHGEVDLRVGEHHPRRHRTRHVALDRALSVDVHAVGRGQARRVSGHLGDVREHPRGRGLAVRAGDRGDRHARGRARREQHVDHGTGRVARLALARRHVHPEARCRIDLADAAADRAIALRDVRGQEIHATHVEADCADRAHRHVAVVGVDHVGDVGGRAAGRQVRGRAQVHAAARLGHRAGFEPGAREHRLRLRVEFEARQHLLVAYATARILVHDLDEFGDRAPPVADDVARRAAGRGDQLAVHHQQAMVVALEEALHDHRT